MHIFQSILRQFSPGVSDHLIRYRLADQDYFHLLFLARIRNDLIQDLRIRESQLLRYEVTYPIIEITTPDQVITQEKARHDREKNNDTHVTSHDLFPLFIQENFLRIFQQTNDDKRSQTDKNRIDKIQIKSTEKVIQIATRQPESSRTKRRHQSRSDSYTRNHVTLTLCRARHDSGQTAEESDQYIVYRRLRTGKQLALRLADR